VATIMTPDLSHGWQCSCQQADETMRKTIVILSLIALAACSTEEKKAAAAAPPFSEKEFVTNTLLTVNSNVQLAAMAAKRGRVEQTRAFGAAMLREQQSLQNDLAAAARELGAEIPKGVEEKKVALRDNLSILPGQVFDRGYTLAMLQDLRGISRQMERASKSSNARVAQLSKQYLPILAQEQKAAKAALDRVGGSPFAFE
jgi:predicted outer membrane protein